MLIGLLAKNAILIVEFAVQQRRAGLSIIESALEGSRMRLRPILMTSLAFIAGLVPLMWTVGPSAQGNHSISFGARSEEHTSELQSLMRISYAVFCLKTKTNTNTYNIE